MAIEELQVYVDNDRCAAARIGLGIELASQHGARLLGVYARRPIYDPMYIGTYLPADVVRELERHADEYERAAREQFEKVIEGCDIPVDWHTLAGQLPGSLCETARLGDLLVLNRGYDDEGVHRWYRPDTAVLASGGPVLVLPPSSGYHLPSEHSLIAWNGSREAARAVRDALPLLAHSRKISIASIVEGSTPGVGPEVLAESLARRGLSAEVLPAARIDAVHHGDAGQTLLSLADENAMDLIVTGAYGRSRVQELVLGGVTRYLLGHASVALLMSH